MLPDRVEPVDPVAPLTIPATVEGAEVTVLPGELALDPVEPPDVPVEPTVPPTDVPVEPTVPTVDPVELTVPPTEDPVELTVPPTWLPVDATVDPAVPPTVLPTVEETEPTVEPTVPVTDEMVEPRVEPTSEMTPPTVPGRVPTVSGKVPTVPGKVPVVPLAQFTAWPRMPFTSAGRVGTVVDGMHGIGEPEPPGGVALWPAFKVVAGRAPKMEPEVPAAAVAVEPPPATVDPDPIPVPLWPVPGAEALVPLFPSRWVPFVPALPLADPV